MFNVGDRVRVSGYRVYDKETDINGKIGTILTIDDEEDGGYIDVRLDEEVAGLNDWLFVPSEIEAADN